MDNNQLYKENSIYPMPSSTTVTMWKPSVITEDLDDDDENITYSAKGFVFGMAWEMQYCTYNSKEYAANTIEQLHDRIKEDVISGSIDSGMGFYKVLGAVMDVTTTRTIIVNERTYTNESIITEYHGKDIGDDIFDQIQNNAPIDEFYLFDIEEE